MYASKVTNRNNCVKKNTECSPEKKKKKKD